MTNGHPVITRKVQEVLESNGVLANTKEIQHATQLTACYGFSRAFILVFNTGAIVVQGQPSTLQAWLLEVKHHLETNTEVPRFPRPGTVMPPSSDTSDDPQVYL